MMASIPQLGGGSEDHPMESGKGVGAQHDPSHRPPSAPDGGRLETAISLKIGTARNFCSFFSPPTPTRYNTLGEAKGLPEALGGKPRDLYMTVILDQEEVYRTATIEKSLK